MKNRLVMGTLTLVLAAGSISAAETDWMKKVYGETLSSTEPSATEAPEAFDPLPTETAEPSEPAPTEIPAPTEAPVPTEIPAPTEAPAPTETPVPVQPPVTLPPEPGATVTPTPVEPSATVTPEPTPSPVPAEFSVKIKADPQDALVVVLDPEGNILTPDSSGCYKLQEKLEYEIYVRKEGYQEVHQKITADPSVTEYQIRLLNQDAALKGLYVSSSDKYGKGILKLNPVFSPEQDKYQAVYDGERESLNIWPEVNDPGASVKVYAISGIKASTVEKDETIKGTTDKKNHPYWKIFFADQEKKATVRIQVTAEDGTEKDTYVTLNLTDLTAPVLRRISASRISTEAASVVYKTRERGKCYYQVIDAGEKVPTLDTGGPGTDILAGTNTISLTGLTEGEKDIVIVVKDEAGNVSSPLVIRIPDIRKNDQMNLVHGSDHGGNKSQAVLPGKGGEGSLSNLKQINGTKSSSKIFSDSVKKQEEVRDNLGTSKKVPAWTLKKHLILAKELHPGYRVDGKLILTKKEENASRKENQKETSVAGTENVTDTKTVTGTKTVAAAPTGTQTSHVGIAGKIVRSWRQTRLLTKILLVFAVIGILFLLFFAGAKRRFRKLLKLQGK